MILEKLVNIMQRFVDPLSFLLNSIAKVFLTIMMLLTGIDVAMRYFLGCPIEGSYEMIQYMMTIVVSFSLATCGLMEGHVQVELLTSLFSEKIQTMMKAAAYFVMCFVFGLIAWQTTIRGYGMQAVDQQTEVLYLPIFPFAYVVAFGCGALGLVALKKFIENLNLVVQS